MLIGYIIILAFILTWAATGLVTRVSKRAQFFDRPNERSSHTVPTPRGGGWGVMVILLPLWLCLGAETHVISQQIWVFLGVFILMNISWIDDLADISPKWRLLVQFAAVIMGLFALPNGTITNFLPRWVELAALAMGWLWFTNLYNFMDGIDGISGAETASIAVGLLLLPAAPLFIAPYAAALLGCALGFLIWNWHPAKVFLGDIGSIPLGYLIGFLLISLAYAGLWLPALILPLYYLVDATYTLLKRALAGKKFWQPHREHFYQRALARAKHHHVVLVIIACNAGLVAAALASVTLSPLAGLLALLPLALALYLLHRWAASQTPR